METVLKLNKEVVAKRDRDFNANIQVAKLADTKEACLSSCIPAMSMRENSPLSKIE